MRYLTDIFNPATYAAFGRSDKSVAGVRPSQRAAADKVRPGDILISYLTKFHRWVGLLEVIEGPFDDSTPRFVAGDDPFTIRFKVKPLVWLERNETLPIDLPDLWDHLSFTRARSKSDYWTGPLRRSLNEIKPDDASVLVEALKAQAELRVVHEIDDADWEAATKTTTMSGDREVELEIPTTEEAQDVTTSDSSEPLRESHEIQGLLAWIGAQMHFKVWLPANDRQAILKHRPELAGALLTSLPLGFDSFTMSTVQAIDVVWVKGRNIVRAFEVEHTTSVYSGLLRMADLLALQPNLQIKLHIVAPIERSGKFFSEVKRPVFSFLEPTPLHNVCTFLSYDAIKKLAKMESLSDTRPEYLDKLVEELE